MFAAHKPLKHKYGMIMACLQYINHKKLKQVIMACLQHVNHKYEMNALWQEWQV